MTLFYKCKCETLVLVKKPWFM